jgi:hypothetical protein
VSCHLNWQKKQSGQLGFLNLRNKKKGERKSMNRDIWNAIKHTNICIMLVPGVKEGGRIFEEVMAKNPPNYRKAQQTQSKINSKKSILYHSQAVKTQREKLKAAKGNYHIQNFLKICR